MLKDGARCWVEGALCVLAISLLKDIFEYWLLQKIQNSLRHYRCEISFQYITGKGY